MAIPILHPVAKTAQELRRSIDRITLYRQTNPEDQYVPTLLDLLKRASDVIPDTYKEG